MIEFSTALTAAKTSVEMLTRTAKPVHDTDIKLAIFDAVSKALEVQQALVEANDEISNLRKQIKEFTDWTDRSATYKLTQRSDSVVYKSMKASVEHYACPIRFEKHQIHILNPHPMELSSLYCSVCKTYYPSR